MASKKKAVQEANEAAKAQFYESLISGENPDFEPVVGGKNLKFEEGTQIEGRIAKLPYTAGKSNAFDITLDAGDGEEETVTYWSPTILTNLMKKLRVGDYVVIKCIGLISTANGDAYDFAIARKRH